MSTPGSPAPSEAAAARGAADRARARPPVTGDPAFDAVRRAAAGTPALVTAPDGSPAYWLVPFDLDGRACGVAQVALDASRAGVSALGAGSADRAAWPDVEWFARVPAEVLQAVQVRHPGHRWATPRLSYDGSPQRWAWRLDTEPPGALVVFVSTGGWYERGTPAPAAGER
nr:hypothetical protein [uncultured bacterium]